MKKIPLEVVLFVLFLLLYSAVSIYFTYGLHIYHNDAISRTALGFFTVFGRNPHLAAVGFVWQPLLSLAQVPLLLLLKPFGLMMIAGPLLTSFAGACSVVIIYKIGGLLMNRKRLVPCIVAILFGLNPMILLYASIGTSEMIFIVNIVFSTYYLLKWYYNTKIQHLILACMFLSLSFWSRYESLPFFAACCLLLILKAVIEKFKFKKLEASLIQFSLPFIYSVALWILVNWLIMNDPFYFMNSPYSNSAFTEILKKDPTTLGQSYHSILSSFFYVMERSLYLAPIIILVLLVPFFFWFRDKTKNILLFAFLTLPYWAILVFHMYQLYKGESFGWLRFYMYVIVMGSFIAFYFARKNVALAVLSISLLLLGLGTSAYAMYNPAIGREEESFVRKTLDPTQSLDFSRTYDDQKKIANITDDLNGNILLDTDKGFAIPLFSKNPNKFVITSDVDYVEIVKKYPSSVEWIIVPKPVSDDRGQNKIYTYYPNIWEGMAPKITLYKQIDDWRIYKVEE